MTNEIMKKAACGVLCFEIITILSTTEEKIKAKQANRLD